MVSLKQPTPAQLRILNSTAKRRIIRGGRRGGKTTLSAMLAVKAFGQGRRVLYAVPTGEQLAAFWEEVKRALAEPIDRGTFEKNETWHTITAKGTTQRIRAKTAWNADSLRGDYADLLILDEWQLMDEEAWEQVGAPMLLDNDGDALFIYTPPSLQSRSVTKARDPRHAAKMFAKAQKDKSGRWEAFHFTSHDNPHLAEAALAEIASDMTVLGYRQEILAEDVEEIPGALWKQSLIDATRIDREMLPPMERIVVGVDPSGSSTTEAGIVAVGRGRDGQRYVLADKSLLAPSPEAWGAAAVALYESLSADRIVGERNFGGDMVEAVIRTVSRNVSYKDCVSSRGKLVRAEPVCAAFEKSRAHLVGAFPEMETEMVTYVPGNRSPNRLDAMVFAMTELGETAELGLIEWFKNLVERGKEAIDKLLDESKAASETSPRDELAGKQAALQIEMRLRGLVRNAPAENFVEERPPCPKCFATCTVQIPGQHRCNQCGWQWGTPYIERPPSRKSLSEAITRYGGF